EIGHNSHVQHHARSMQSGADPNQWRSRTEMTIGLERKEHQTYRGSRGNRMEKVYCKTRQNWEPRLRSRHLSPRFVSFREFQVHSNSVESIPTLRTPHVLPVELAAPAIAYRPIQT